MAVRGERIHLDLDSDQEDSQFKPTLASTSRETVHVGFVRDITERSTSDTTTIPPPPTSQSSDSGFPAHKRRFKTSASKQQRNRDVQASGTESLATPRVSKALKSRKGVDRDAQNDPSTAYEAVQKRAIHEENEARIARMSPNEIAEEREMLLSGLSPSLIERLLKRANIDEGRTDLADDSKQETKGESILPKNELDLVQPKPEKKVTFDIMEKDMVGAQYPHPTTIVDPDAPPVEPPKDLFPASSHILPPAPNIHFPKPPTVPSLDPSDPDFLENLRSKYFPHLPVDPSKMAWMAPIPSEDSPGDQDSPYHPSQASLPISSLRFDFRGRLIPPRLARQIPSTKGLHHHGLAPEAAGYTVPELAHLSRSSFPAQRCIAYQTLGRILYRLGRGDFGTEDDELYLGLWKSLEEGRVLDTLLAEAGMEDGKGHRSCKITATEAVWLWQKGGGKRVRAQ